MPRRLITVAAIGLLLLVSIFTASSCATANHPVDITQAKELFYANELGKARPLLQAAYAEASDNPEVCCYLAEVSRRLGQHDEAAKYANEALESDPCNAFAHTVLASVYEPMWSNWEHASIDLSWHHAEAAVECDSTDGNAWLVVWLHALRRQDLALEAQALTALHKSSFFSDPVLEYNRWVLSTLPENAILLTNGDLDTYPAAVLQQVNGLRPDVAIVNLSLLNTEWYDDYLVTRYGINPPIPDEPAGGVTGSQSGAVVTSAAMKRISGWLAQRLAGELANPITVAATARSENLPADMRDNLRYAGSYYAAGESPAAGEDVRLLAAAFDAAELAAYERPTASEQDRSPVRRSSSGFCARNICEAGIKLCEALHRDNDTEAAQHYLETLKDFVVRTGIEEQLSDKLKALEETLKG